MINSFSEMEKRTTTINSSKCKKFKKALMSFIPAMDMFLTSKVQAKAKELQSSNGTKMEIRINFGECKTQET